MFRRPKAESETGAPEPRVKAIEREIEAINQQRTDLSLQVERLAEQLTAERESLGAAFLAGDESGLTRVREITDRVDMMRRAIAVLDERRAEAETRKKAATVLDLRDSAQRKSDELEQLRAATAELLKSLSDLEDVPYTHVILQGQPTGMWYAAPPGAGLSDDYASPWERGPEPAGVNAGGYAVSRSRRLRNEINALSWEADAIEAELSPPPAPPTRGPEERGPTLYGEPPQRPLVRSAPEAAAVPATEAE